MAQRDLKRSHLESTGLKRWRAGSLLALLLPGLCAVAQAGPRPGLKGKAHEAAAVLNTTLPVPEFAGLRGTSPRRASPDSHGRLADEGGVAAVVADESAGAEGAAGRFPIEWRESRELVGPGLVEKIRHYKRDGLPVVSLWEQGQSRVAIGLNPHGLPGIYFTHHVGG